MTHRHSCVACGHSWECFERAKRCKVETARAVNGDGPYCGLCLHLEMAKRHAENRGLRLVVTLAPQGADSLGGRDG